MKKRRIKISIFALIIILFLALPLTKPSPETFNEWLESKYDIECVDESCMYRNSKKKIVHRTIDNYILTNKMGVILEDADGVRTLIEGVGIFGTFIPFTFSPGYNPLIDIYQY